MLKKFLLSLMAPAIAFSAIAATIKGKIVDTESQPLPGATVKLINLNDSTTKDLVMADKKGEFSFTKKPVGNYAIVVSMTGMDEVSKNIEIKSADETKNLGNISLNESSVMLQEMVVKGVKAAVVAKQDTIEFNAGSYHTKTNATVEDLIKKLPGVEVSSDGTITSGGKTVTKIYVDGKEFFGDDTHMATKNLPSNMVDKVQVVDKKSDLAKLTGVDDGEEETIINLTVKKNMKNGWFGNFAAGYGTDGRYEGSFNVSTFRDGSQVSFVGGLNNINELGFSDMGRGRFMSFGPNGGITTAQRFGLNFNIGKTDDFRFGGNVFYSHSDRKATSYTETEYQFPDSVSYGKSGSYSRDKGHNLRANLRLQWNIDKSNTIDFRPNFSFNNRNSFLNDTSRLNAGDIHNSLVNTNDSRRNNHGTSYNFDGTLVFNHKFLSHPGRSFSVQVNYNFSDTKQRTTSWSDIEYLLRQEDSELLFRYLDNHQWGNTIGGRLTWTEPLGDVKRGNFLTFAYRMNWRFNNGDKGTYDLPEPEDIVNFELPDYSSIPEGAEFNQNLSNKFRNRFMTQELRVGYKKVSSLYNLETGIVVAPSTLESTDILNPERSVPNRTTWNVAPFLRLRYKFSKTKSLSIDYRANTSSPSTSQLQPVADVSNPLNIVIGNPDLKPTFNQSVNVHFNNYNMDAQRSLMAMGRVQYSTNSIVSKTVSNPETGGRTTTYTNANGNINAFGMFMINQPLRNRSWRFNARMRASFSSYAGYINGDFNRSGNLNLAPSFGMTFSSDIFQMTVNPTYGFQMTTNSLPNQKSRYVHNYGFDADAALYLPFGLEITSDISFSNASGYSQGFDAKSWLWNAQISYSVLSDKSLTFSVRAYDLLGQKKNVSRSVSNSSIVDNRYNDLTRYVMFGVSWKFNTMANKARSAGVNNFEDRPGPPPGMGPGGNRGNRQGGNMGGRRRF